MLIFCKLWAEVKTEAGGSYGLTVNELFCRSVKFRWFGVKFGQPRGSHKTCEKEFGGGGGAHKKLVPDMLTFRWVWGKICR